jgi:hypothetical protein
MAAAMSYIDEKHQAKMTDDPDSSPLSVGVPCKISQSHLAK